MCVSPGNSLLKVKKNILKKKKNLYKNVHHCFIFKCPEFKTIQMSIHKGSNKQYSSNIVKYHSGVEMNE